VAATISWRVTHARAFVGEAHQRFNVGKPIEYFFDAGCASGAGHSGNAEFDALSRHVVAGAAYRFDDVLGRNRGAVGDIDPGALGRKINRGADAGNAIEVFLDARSARGAGHA
jgi:hypothetical protein